MAVYQSQYRTRFFLCMGDFVTYPAIVTYLPNDDLSEIELKAILAFLNSSFSQLYIETEGRATALGLIALEITQAAQMPLPNVKQLDRGEIEQLALAFDSLEKAAREIGGADTKEKLKVLEVKFVQIDSVVSQIFGFNEDFANWVRELVSILMDRRIARTGEAAPEILKSKKMTLKIKRPRSTPKIKKANAKSQKLDIWSERK
jgi:hypothetical protein